MPTLADFFAFSSVSFEDHSSVEAAERIKSLKAAVAAKAGQSNWPAIRDEALGRLGHLLDIRVVDILAATWNKYQVLRKAADKTRSSPNETVMVSFVKHTVQSVHRPYVEILVDEQPVGRINFEILVELIMEGALASVRSGKIVEVRVGSCKGRGVVKCESATIIERDTKPFDLPGRILLEEGIAIT